MMKVIASVHDYFNEEVFSIAYNNDIDVETRIRTMMAKTEFIFIDQETGKIDGNVGVESSMVIPAFRPMIQQFFNDFIKAIKTLYLTEFDEKKANGLAIRAVAEIEGALILARVFDDKNYLQKTLDRLIKRIEKK